MFLTPDRQMSGTARSGSWARATGSAPFSSREKPHYSEAIIALQKDRIRIQIQIDRKDAEKLRHRQLRKSRDQEATNKEHGQ